MSAVINKDSSNKSSVTTEGIVRPSIAVRLIRHAESENNQVYRDARFLFRGGTPDFDEEGWNQYVDKHRKADPGLSDKGQQQADHLANFLGEHLQNQASLPVRVVTSPMKRTLETIKPTLERLTAQNKNQSVCQVICNAFYHESEGCHIREQAEEGMNPQEISQLLHNATDDISFEGFPLENRGWYAEGEGAETRAQSEARAAKFYVWLCEYLDQQLYEPSHDIFDAGVALPEEQHECDHDLLSPKTRRRRMTLLIGHGDFMSLVLKRIVAGYGHAVEVEGIPHRSAFVHFNTAITELEYFGNGRFLLMATNTTPHFAPNEYSSLRTGGSLKDGWSFLVPSDEFLLDAEVSIGFEDELEDHVREQAEALKALYLSDAVKDVTVGSTAAELSVEEVDGRTEVAKDGGHAAVCIVVKRGLQVAGCAWYDESTGRISDIVIRPSARESQVGEALITAVRAHARKLKRSGSILVQPHNLETKEFLVGELGFQEVDGSMETSQHGDVHVEI